jgi:acylglycerol lipase
MVQYDEDWILGPENSKFYTRRYDTVNAKAHIVFVHGFQEHIARFVLSYDISHIVFLHLPHSICIVSYDHFFTKFAANNISVFAFDQRGWGRTACDERERSPGARYGWTSRPRQLADLEFFIKREAAHITTDGKQLPLFLMGHSMVCFIIKPY